jgi:hypothetical protein
MEPAVTAPPGPFEAAVIGPAKLAEPVKTLSPAPSPAYTPFNVVSRALVFNPRLTAPDVVVAVTGLLPVTLVMVPGKVCVGANEITPV